MIMNRTIVILMILIPNILYADQGLNLSCKNMLSVFGKKYEPLNFKLEATGFHYFDKKHKKLMFIPSKKLEFGDDRFTVKFIDYELGFQRIIFAGENKPTITMSKYDNINDKFIDHYECEVIKSHNN